MPLSRCIYFSSANNQYDTSTILTDIARVSRINNLASAVTGCLVRLGDHYIQYLEGRRHHVGGCYNRIVTDARHHDVVLVQFQEIDERMFAGWELLRPSAEEVLDLANRFALDHVFVPAEQRASTFVKLFEELAARFPRTAAPPQIEWDR